MKRQKTQKQLLFSANLFRRVWVGSSRTLEPVISQTTKWKLHPELPPEEACIIQSKHRQLIHPATDLCESSKSNGTRLGKMSIAPLYYSAVPCLVTRTGYAGASSQWLPGLPVSSLLVCEEKVRTKPIATPGLFLILSALQNIFRIWNLCTLHP